MSLDRNDPRLTAYALGELDDLQRADVEALLETDAAARDEVVQLTGLADELSQALRAAQEDPSVDDLDAERRGVVVTGARWDSAGARSGGRVWRRLAAAAALVIVGFPALMILLMVCGIFTPGGGGRGLRNADEQGAAAGRIPIAVADGQLPDGAEGLPGTGPDSVVVDQEPVSQDPLFENTAGVPGDSPERRTARLHLAAHGETGARSSASRPAGGGSVGVGGGAGGGFVDLTASGAPRLPGARPAAGAIGFRLELEQGRRTAVPRIDAFQRVTAQGGHTSTFGVDVDTAAYSQIRRLLQTGSLPHRSIVRLEELINYFDYGYAPPERGSTQPFRTHVQLAACPWNPQHRLARIALKGREVDAGTRPPVNLVFLVDVSGSMDEEDKLPLVRTGLETLAEQMRPNDRVAIVTYASTATVALASTPGSEKAAILAAIRGLRAGGSTNGAGGIQLAYEQATKGFVKEGVNRVLLCTDGDFNVGVSDTGGLVRLIQQKVATGVYLSVLGYGTGNFQDGKMEQLSGHGNGNYAYIDSQRESRRVLVEQLDGTLVTIAKDVKFQLWFNPKTVAGWRLLGYENRRLAARDFNDDTKDAGDVGAGHEVTALYEIIPTGAGIPGAVDPNPFVAGADAVRAPDAPTPAEKALFIWRLRWKAPGGGASTLVEHDVFDAGLGFEQADRDFQWATAAAAFGMLLRHAPHGGQVSWDLVSELATPARGEDPQGVRAEFLELIAKARALQQR